MSAITLNDKREICIDLQWLLSGLSAEQKRELADSLSCDDDIIADVSAQLLDGWTDAGSHGAVTSGDAEPTTALGKARRELALRAGERASEEIADLKRMLIWQKQIADHYSGCYFTLYHAWPSGISRMPDTPSIAFDMPKTNYEIVEKATK